MVFVKSSLIISILDNFVWKVKNSVSRSFNFSLNDFIVFEISSSFFSLSIEDEMRSLILNSKSTIFFLNVSLILFKSSIILSFWIV